MLKQRTELKAIGSAVTSHEVQGWRRIWKSCDAAHRCGGFRASIARVTFDHPLWFALHQSRFINESSVWTGINNRKPLRCWSTVGGRQQQRKKLSKGRWCQSRGTSDLIVWVLVTYSRLCPGEREIICLPNALVWIKIIKLNKQEPWWVKKWSWI